MTNLPPGSWSELWGRLPSDVGKERAQDIFRETWGTPRGITPEMAWHVLRARTGGQPGPGVQEAISEYTRSGRTTTELLDVLSRQGNVGLMTGQEAGFFLSQHFGRFGGIPPGGPGTDRPGYPWTQWMTTMGGRQLQGRLETLFEDAPTPPEKWPTGMMHRGGATMYPSDIYTREWRGIPSDRPGGVMMAQDPTNVLGLLKGAKRTQMLRGAYEQIEMFGRAGQNLMVDAPFLVGGESPRVERGFIAPIAFTLTNVLPEGMQALSTIVDPATGKRVEPGFGSHRVVRHQWFQEGATPGFVPGGTEWGTGQAIQPFRGSSPMRMGLGFSSDWVRFLEAKPLSQEEALKIMPKKEGRGSVYRMIFEAAGTPPTLRTSIGTGPAKYTTQFWEAGAKLLGTPGYGVSEVKDITALPFVYWQAHPEQARAVLAKEGIADESWMAAGPALTRAFVKDVLPRLHSRQQITIPGVHISMLGKDKRGVFPEDVWERATVPGRPGYFDMTTRQPVDIIKSEWFMQATQAWGVKRGMIPHREMGAIREHHPAFYSRVMAEPDVVAERRARFGAIAPVLSSQVEGYGPPPGAIKLTEGDVQSTLLAAEEYARGVASEMAGREIKEVGELPPWMLERAIVQQAAMKFGEQPLELLSGKFSMAPEHVRRFSVEGPTESTALSKIERGLGSVFRAFGGPPEVYEEKVERLMAAQEEWGGGAETKRMALAAHSRRVIADQVVMSTGLQAHQISVDPGDLARAYGLKGDRAESFAKAWAAGRVTGEARGFFSGQPSPPRAYEKTATIVRPEQAGVEFTAGRRIVANPVLMQAIGRDADKDQVWTTVTGEAVVNKQGQWQVVEPDEITPMTPRDVQELALEAYQQGRPDIPLGETKFTWAGFREKLSSGLHRWTGQTFQKGHATLQEYQAAIGLVYNRLEDIEDIARPLGGIAAAHRFKQQVHGRTQVPEPLPEDLGGVMGFLTRYTPAGGLADVVGPRGRTGRYGGVTGISGGIREVFRGLALGESLSPEDVARMMVPGGMRQGVPAFIRDIRGAGGWRERVKLWEKRSPAFLESTERVVRETPLGGAIGQMFAGRKDPKTGEFIETPESLGLSEEAFVESQNRYLMGQARRDLLTRSPARAGMKGLSLFERAMRQLAPQYGDLLPSRGGAPVPHVAAAPEEPVSAAAPPAGGLPPLAAGFVRAVHLGPEQAAESIRRGGLRYKGDISTTARAWSRAEDVELASSDRRFAGMQPYVFDVPEAEWQRHVRVETAPGVLDPRYLVSGPGQPPATGGPAAPPAGVSDALEQAHNTWMQGGFTEEAASAARQQLSQAGGTPAELGQLDQAMSAGPPGPSPAAGGAGGVPPRRPGVPAAAAAGGIPPRRHGRGPAPPGGPQGPRGGLYTIQEPGQPPQLLKALPATGLMAGQAAFQNLMDPDYGMKYWERELLPRLEEPGGKLTPREATQVKTLLSEASKLRSFVGGYDREMAQKQTVEPEKTARGRLYSAGREMLGLPTEPSTLYTGLIEKGSIAAFRAQSEKRLGSGTDAMDKFVKAVETAQESLDKYGGTMLEQVRLYEQGGLGIADEKQWRRDVTQMVAQGQRVAQAAGAVPGGVGGQFAGVLGQWQGLVSAAQGAGLAPQAGAGFGGAGPRGPVGRFFGGIGAAMIGPQGQGPMGVQGPFRGPERAFRYLTDYWNLFRMRRIWGMTGGVAMGAIPTAAGQEMAAGQAAAAGMPMGQFQMAGMPRQLMTYQAQRQRFQGQMGRAAYGAWGGLQRGVTGDALATAAGIGLPAIGAGAILGIGAQALIPRLAATAVALPAAGILGLYGAGNYLAGRAEARPENQIGLARARQQGPWAALGAGVGDVFGAGAAQRLGPEAGFWERTAASWRWLTDPTAYTDEVVGQADIGRGILDAPFGQLAFGARTARIQDAVRRATAKDQPLEWMAPEAATGAIGQWQRYMPSPRDPEGILADPRFAEMAERGETPAAYARIATQWGMGPQGAETVLAITQGLTMAQADQRGFIAGQYAGLQNLGIGGQDIYTQAMGGQLPQLGAYSQMQQGRFIARDPGMISQLGLSGGWVPGVSEMTGRMGPDWDLVTQEPDTGLPIGTSDAGLSGLILGRRMGEVGAPGRAVDVSTTGQVTFNVRGQSVKVDFTEWGLQDFATQERRTAQRWQFGFQQQGLNLQGAYMMGTGQFAGMGVFPMRQEGLDLQAQQFGERQDFARQRLLGQAAWTGQDINQQWGRTKRRFEWAGEDLAFRGAQSTLQYGWQMEDIEEAMRYSTGRERRQLMRQRERGTIMYAMGMGQLDTEEGRLEERRGWASEDHEKAKSRHQQSVQWSLQEMDLSRRHFDENHLLSQRRLDAEQLYWEENHSRQQAQLSHSHATWELEQEIQVTQTAFVRDQRIQLGNYRSEWYEMLGSLLRKVQRIKVEVEGIQLYLPTSLR